MRFSLWGYQQNRKDTAEKRPALTNGGQSPIHLLVAYYALNAVPANCRKTQSDTCTLQIELAARGAGVYNEYSTSPWTTVRFSSISSGPGALLFNLALYYIESRFPDPTIRRQIRN